MNREKLLKIFLENEPEKNSPYSLYNYPPMWFVGKANGLDLYVRPAITQEKTTPWGGYVETPGVSYQHHDGEKWIGQGVSCTIPEFCKDFNNDKILLCK